MTTGGPTAVGVCDRKIYRSRLLLFPNGGGNLFAVQQVMLDAGEDAAPVTTVNRFVNDSANFDINFVATQNPVVYPAQQIQQAALLPHRGLAVRLLTIAPGFGFVMRHEA